jgi:hypothetical protein
VIDLDRFLFISVKVKRRRSFFVALIFLLSTGPLLPINHPSFWDSNVQEKSEPSEMDDIQIFFFVIFGLGFN